MLYWWQKNPSFKKISEEVRLLFLKNGIIPPQDILPNVILPGDTVEILFKTKLRQIIRSKTVTKNFSINNYGEIMTDLKGSNLIICVDHQGKKEFDELMNKKNIDLSFRGEK